MSEDSSYSVYPWLFYISKDITMLWPQWAVSLSGKTLQSNEYFLKQKQPYDTVFTTVVHLSNDSV